MPQQEFTPHRGMDLETRIRTIEDWAMRYAGRVPITSNPAINAAAAPTVAPAGGGGGGLSGTIPEASVVFDPGQGHSHDGALSHTVGLAGDVTGNNTAAVITGLPEAKVAFDPAAGHSHNGVDAHTVPLVGDVTGSNEASVVGKVQGKVFPAPIDANDGQFVRWNKTTPAFEYAAGTTTLSGDVTGPNTATVVGKANGVTLPTPVAGDTHKALHYSGSAYVLLTVQFKGVAKSASYVLTADEMAVWADATTAGFTVTLPTAVGIADRVYVVKKTDASAHVVTIAAAGGETIDGAATVGLTVQYQSITIVSNGTVWYIV